MDVKWGARIERIEEVKDGVTAFFEDGSTASGVPFCVAFHGVHSLIPSGFASQATSSLAQMVISFSRISDCRKSSLVGRMLLRLPLHLLVVSEESFWMVVLLLLLLLRGGGGEKGGVISV